MDHNSPEGTCLGYWVISNVVGLGFLFVFGDGIVGWLGDFVGFCSFVLGFFCWLCLFLLLVYMPSSILNHMNTIPLKKAKIQI